MISLDFFSAEPTVFSKSLFALFDPAKNMMRPTTTATATTITMVTLCSSFTIMLLMYKQICERVKTADCLSRPRPILFIITLIFENIFKLH